MILYSKKVTGKGGENRSVFGNRAKISAEELAYMKEQLDNDRGFFENVNAKSKLIEADFDAGEIKTA